MFLHKYTKGVSRRLITKYIAYVLMNIDSSVDVSYVPKKARNVYRPVLIS